MPAENSAYALLGGAFDPPHAGHIRLARAALADLPIREIRIVPNGDPRHRGVCAPWADRVAMCEMAFAGIPHVKIRRDESPGVPRFSADTLRGMKSEEPDAGIVFIVGADAFAGLESWREWRELFSLTHFAVAPRKSAPPLSPALAAFCAERFCDDPADLRAGAGKVLRWNVSAPEVSSSELRERIFSASAQGGKGGWTGENRLITENVLEYACERALYG